MQVVREILPNGKPIILDALIDDNGEVMPNSIRVFPVAVNIMGEPRVADRLAILSIPRLADRLAKHLTTNNEATQKDHT